MSTLSPVPQRRLTDRVALVTGSARGIGRAAAGRLAAEGASVAINYLNSREAAESAVGQIREQGGQSIAIQGDVSSSSDIERIVAETLKSFGTIDILVNNAGVSVEKPFLEHTEEEWDWSMAVNLKGVFLCTRAVLPVMLEGSGGKIVNMSSISDTVGDPSTSAYCTTKGGVKALTTQLALEFGPSGINVNAVAPGFIATTMNEKWLEDELAMQQIISATPLGRAGTPEDVAGAVAFLASPDSDFITGATIYVDGGWLTQ